MVIGSDVAHKFAFQIVQGREDASGDDVALDLREPELHLVQPGGVGRREVQLHMRMGMQEGLDMGGLVRREIVEDHVNLLAAWLMRHDVGEERDELSGGMACGRSPEHLTGLRVECRVERERAVAGVLKAVPFGAPGGQGQHGIQAIERLDGGFLIDTEDRRMLRGCRYSPNTSAA